MEHKFVITWPAVLGFLALSFAFAEMHELVHTNAGYLFGGCYGERDFKVWGLCEASKAHPLSYIATLAGPAFTFIAMWAGYLMMRRAADLPGRAFGMAILFASMPFGRILTVLLQSGDEYLVMRQLFGDGDNHKFLWLLTTTIILAICTVPLLGAFRALPARRRWLAFLALFIGPTVLFIPIVIIGLNSLLLGGMLAGPGLLGAPMMITLWFALCLSIAGWKRAHLRTWLI